MRRSQTRFRGGSTFDETEFHIADFEQAEFYGSASFGDVGFHSDALFNGTKFHGMSLFNGAKFHGYTLFVNSEFYGDAVFSGVEFSDEAQFLAALFHSSLDFEEVVVSNGGSIDLDGAAVMDPRESILPSGFCAVDESIPGAPEGAWIIVGEERG